MSGKRIVFPVLSLFFLVVFACSGIHQRDVPTSHGHHNETISGLKEELTRAPGSVTIRNRLGLAYLKTGRYAEAADEFTRVLEMDPDNALAVFRLGLVFINNDEMNKAIDLWQGYSNRYQPHVEKEICQHLTLLKIAESHRAAREALVSEEKLMTVTPPPHSVAVTYYQDLSPDRSLRAFQKGLAAMVITNLSNVESIEVVERLRMHALLQEIELAGTGIVSDTAAPRVGRLLGAENIIIGSLDTGSIRATTTVVSVSEDGILSTNVISVEKENFYELPAMITKEVIKAIGGQLSSSEEDAISEPYTKVYEAFIRFGEAIDALDSGNWQKSNELLEKAITADPGFSLAREVRDITPESESPDAETLKRMNAKQLSKHIETAMDTTISSKVEEEIDHLEYVEEIQEEMEEPEISEEEEVLEQEELFLNEQNEVAEEIREETLHEISDLPQFPSVPE
ncbi:MAG: tetratricopeptide repeat protein [Thermodesulfobacteriota bacterium]|nr:tetratricopeptide repeat protein [Thermodesulfobacteriota bacterium]